MVLVFSIVFTPLGQSIVHAQMLEEGRSQNNQIIAELSTISSESISNLSLSDLANTKKKLILSLENLTIDPEYEQEQIFKKFFKLGISFNLPNIPFPSVPSLASYDESAARNYVKHLLSLDITDEDKEALLRLTIFEELTERLYKENLVMAEDFGTCLYNVSRIILAGRLTLTSILTVLTNVPGLGRVAARVLYFATTKSTEVINRVVNTIMSLVGPPFDEFVPKIVQKIVNLAVNSLESSIVGKMLPWATKTLSKYAFTSMPYIGYIPRTQPLVDAAVIQAAEKDFSSTSSEAFRRVLDDGNSQTRDSVYEQAAFQIARRHDITRKEILAARISHTIGRIAGFAATADPTGIARVVRIISRIFSTGILTHGMVYSAIQFNRTVNHLEHGLHLSFHPETEFCTGNSDLHRHNAPVNKFSDIATQLDRMMKEYDELASHAKKALKKSDATMALESLEKMLSFEEAFESVERYSILLCNAALTAASRSDSLINLMNKSVASDLSRLSLLSDLLAVAAGSEVDMRICSASSASENLNSLANMVGDVLTSRNSNYITPKVGLSNIEFEPTADGLKVSCIATLVSQDSSKVSFTLYGSSDVEVVKCSSEIVMQPWERVRLEWIVSSSVDLKDTPISIAANLHGGVSGFILGFVH